MNPLPARLGTYFRPAFVAYACALLPLLAAPLTHSEALGRLALFVAGAMLAFAAICGTAAIVIAARWRKRRAATPPDSYYFCLGNVLAAALLLALAAVLAIATGATLSGVRLLFGSP